MKLIMENWRKYAVEEQKIEILLETILKLENSENLEEGLFANLLASLSIGAAAMFWTAQNERAQDISSAMAQYEENKIELTSNETKHAELDDLLMNGNAWQWNPSPKAGLGYHKIEKDGEWYTVMPDSWAVAAKVVNDKKAGIVDIPGLAKGELPKKQDLYNSLKNPKTGNPKLNDYNEKYGAYLTATEDHDIPLLGIKGQLSPPTGPELNTYQMSTVAIDPAYFESNPDHITVSGISARDLYISYYFGKYLGAEEAATFGLELQKSEKR